MVVDEGRRGTWAEAGAAVEAELAAWRAAHPRATLTEIELAVEAATARVRAYWLGELTRPEEGTGRPPCPTCGGPLRRRGRRTRRVLVAHQARPLELERAYLWCPACRAGLSPPR